MKTYLRKLSWILVVFLVLVSIPRPLAAPAADATKTQNTLALTWTEIPAGGTSVTSSVASSEIDCTSALSTTLHIDCGLSSTTAQTTGTYIIVQGASEVTVNDAWTIITQFSGPTGTAFHMHVSATEAIGQTVLSITDPTTGNFNHYGKNLFAVPGDDPNVANVEIMHQVTSSADAGDTITVLDPITHALTVDTEIWAIDADGPTGQAVMTYCVSIPPTITRARVIFANGASQSQVHVRVRATQLTAIE